MCTPEKRWRDHCFAAAKGSSSALHRAIRRYGTEAFTIKWIASSCDWKSACDLERDLISQYGTFGKNGYNLTRGGDGTFGYSPDESSRLRRSQVLKGREFSEDTRRKIAEATRRAMTPERRAQLSEQAKLRMADPVYKANVMASHASAEYRAKMSSKHKGRKQSAEHLAKMSAIRRGRKQSPETIAKRVASMIAFYERARKSKVYGVDHA